MYNNVFQGTVSATACGPQHAFELDDDLTRTITATALACPVDDVTSTLRGPRRRSPDPGPADQPRGRDLHRRAASRPAPTRCRSAPSTTRAVTVGQLRRPRSATSDTAAPGDRRPAPRNPRWRYFTANPDPRRPRRHDARPTRSSAAGPAPAGCTHAHRPARQQRRRRRPVGHRRRRPDLDHGRQQRQHPRGLGQPARPGRPAPGAGLADPRVHRPSSPTPGTTSGATRPSWCPAATTSTRRSTNLFVAHNRMHDYSYYLGFTEDNYNLQLEQPRPRRRRRATRRSATPRPAR